MFNIPKIPVEKMPEMPVSENRGVYQPEEWVADPHTRVDYLVRAVLCLEHLIKNNFDEKNIRVLEVGPLPTTDEMHKAPISLLHEIHPELKCVSIGLKDGSEEEIKRTLGDVKYIKGILAEHNLSKKYVEKVIRALGGQPQIIYAQHVFEHSPGFLYSLPVGPYKIFEKSVEILEPKGFIVVDNYGGRLNQIGMMGDWKHSKNMKLTYNYMYEKDKGIYVFQKPLKK